MRRILAWIITVCIFITCFGAVCFADSRIYCKYCGQKVDSDSRFCSYCGKRLDSKTDSTPIYSTVSTTGASLTYPKDSQYLDSPFEATVNGKTGAIYIMPKPAGGNGNLGTLKNGTVVTILAQTNDFYFFETENGECGWNGKGYFKETGSAPSNGSISKSSVTEERIEYNYYYTIGSKSMPSFYCNMSEDVYNNLFTGGDVKITFYTSFAGTTEDQVNALIKYLEKNAEHNTWSWHWKEYVNEKTKKSTYYVCFIDGWNMEDQNKDIQYLWDKNPWTNGNAVELELSFIDYGDIYKDKTALTNAINNQGYSEVIVVQKNTMWKGLSIGMKFLDIYDKVTKKYCFALY